MSQPPRLKSIGLVAALALGLAAVGMLVTVIVTLANNDPRPDPPIVVGVFAATVAAPLGIAVALLMLLGVMSGRARLRESRRMSLGLCVRCGYDLRGISSARCPECGEALLAPALRKT